MKPPVQAGIVRQSFDTGCSAEPLSQDLFIQAHAEKSTLWKVTRNLTFTLKTTFFFVLTPSETPPYCQLSAPAEGGGVKGNPHYIYLIY